MFSLLPRPLLGGGEPHAMVTSARKGLGGRWVRREAWDTGPYQPLESGTGESDHKISCWKMTDSEGKYVKMIRENGIVELTGTKH